MEHDDGRSLFLARAMLVHLVATRDGAYFRCYINEYFVHWALYRWVVAVACLAACALACGLIGGFYYPHLRAVLCPALMFLIPFARVAVSDRRTSSARLATMWEQAADDVRWQAVCLVGELLQEWEHILLPLARTARDNRHQAYGATYKFAELRMYNRLLADLAQRVDRDIFEAPLGTGMSTSQVWIAQSLETVLCARAQFAAEYNLPVRATAHVSARPN